MSVRLNIFALIGRIERGGSSTGDVSVSTICKRKVLIHQTVIRVRKGQRRVFERLVFDSTRDRQMGKCFVNKILQSCLSANVVIKDNIFLDRLERRLIES